MTAHRIAPDPTGLRTPRQLQVPSISVEGRIHRDLHRLLWQLRGASEITVNGTVFSVSAGQALWVPAGAQHTVRLGANSVLFPLGFQIATVRNAPGEARLIGVSAMLRTLLLAHWQRTHTLLRNGDVSGQIVSLVGTSPALPARLPFPTTAAARRVAESLMSNPGDDRGVDELAVAAHASYSTVKRAFVAETGLSPHRWRIRHRMESAASMLSGAGSIPAVASRVGYRNSSAFGRVFREYFGVTPSEYLERVRPAGPTPGAAGALQRTRDSGDTSLPPAAVAARIEPARHLLFWQVRGNSEVWTDGQPATLGVGEAVWIPAGALHQVDVRSNSALLPMEFDAATTETPLARATSVRVDRDLRTLLLARLQWQTTELKAGGDLGVQILGILGELVGLSPPLPMPQSFPALRVAEMLRANPGDGRSATLLAESAHSSYVTIERAFRAETGMTLGQWQRNNRLEAAATLLRSDTSVSVVATRVGYTSLSAFGRAFKQHLGMTPSEYIARYNGNR